MILKKFNKKTKEELKNFLILKDLQCNYLDWCKWAGWIDTDGFVRLLKKNQTKKISLSLRDRQPVELLSNFMECNLVYREHTTFTPEPYRYEYTAKEFITTICGDKVIFFMKKIYPYMLNQEKKLRICKILGYEPESKKLDDWTKQEVISYFATALEGDGSIRNRKCKTKKDTIDIYFSSSDIQYLSDIKYLVDKNFNTCLHLSETTTYKTKQGIKTKYRLYITNNVGNMEEFFRMLAADNIMTLDRKRNKVIQHINQGELNEQRL